MVKKYQDELEKILAGCSICRAKMCKSCPNGKRKKFLKEEINKFLKEEINKFFPQDKSFFKKIKEFFYS